MRFVQLKVWVKSVLVKFLLDSIENTSGPMIPPQEERVAGWHAVKEWRSI